MFTKSFTTRFMLISSVFLCCCVIATPAFAVVVGQETAPSGDWDVSWDYVYNYKGSSAVAVDDYWILTAAHVADDGGSGELVIGSETYTQQEIVFHPNSVDLALVRYDKVLPGYYDLYISSFPSGSGNLLTAVMIGYGYTGEDHDSYYTWDTNTAGTKRWGTNEIDETAQVTYGSWTSKGFWMDYDSIASGKRTEYECGVAQHDSGGGSFVKDVDDVWKLAGINTTVASNAPANPDQYISSFAVSVPMYNHWITNTIPEPTTVSVLLVATTLATLRKKRKI